jgi:hypothetical protein
LPRALSAKIREKQPDSEPTTNGTGDKYRTSPSSQDMALKLGTSISEEFVLSVYGKVKLERCGHVGQGSEALRRRILPFLLEISKVLGFWGRKNKIAEWGFRIVGLWVQRWPDHSPNLFLPNAPPVATE